MDLQKIYERSCGEEKLVIISIDCGRRPIQYLGLTARAPPCALMALPPGTLVLISFPHPLFELTKQIHKHFAKQPPRAPTNRRDERKTRLRGHSLTTNMHKWVGLSRERDRDHLHNLTKQDQQQAHKWTTKSHKSNR